MNEQTDVKCLSCGSTSDHVVLLSCVRDSNQEYVCVRCLPMLIHGPH
ncbi:MAG: hypothetical protein IBX61_01100 [Thermoleophilia bacterium]|nr:hypothetical protein [Thermoleophilia bacterium]